MQCPSCRFENMPGVEACGRCNSTLRLATTVIDVHPPRARPWQKRLRRLFPMRRGVEGAREAVKRANQATNTFFESRELTVPPSDVFVRLPIPGWAHFHLGERLLGRSIAFLYLGLLALGVIFLGTVPGSIFLGLAFSVHASSTLSIMFRYGEMGVSRIGAALLVLAGLALCVYLPIGWAVSWVAWPVTVAEAGAPLAEGDVLLLYPLAYVSSPPKPGDVVLYEAVGQQFTLPGGGHGVLRVAGGERIDRILAGPGSDVLWEGGRLFVNGVPSPLLPLNPASAPGRFETRVPQNQYLIIPTTFPRITTRAPADFWTSTCLVSTENIRAPVYLRTQPFSRFGPIR